MTKLSNINNTPVKSIDIYISDQESAFADICITHNEIFYCLGTEDMREDGHISIDSQKFSRLSQEILNAINNNESCNIAEFIKFKMAVTLSDANKISHDQTSTNTRSIIKIINCLSNECDEFIFLEGFKPLLA